MMMAYIARAAVFLSMPVAAHVLLQVRTDNQKVRIPPRGWGQIFVPLEPNQVLGSRGQSHSQVGQDKLVQSILKCKHGGFFVDLAANDAMHLSNTLMLERDFAWDGICVEANPYYTPGLAKRRCATVLAAVGSPSNQSVDFVYRGVFGGIVSDKFDNHPGANHGGATKLTMQTKALGEILDELNAPHVIDYFSLDVEGAESLVMNGFPWEKYKFNVITVERPKPDLKAALQGHGYRFLLKNSGFDDETWVNMQMPDFAHISDTHWKVPTSEQFAALCPAVV